MVTKRSHILKPSCTWKLQICLSMCDLFVTTMHWRVKTSLWPFWIVEGFWRSHTGHYNSNQENIKESFRSSRSQGQGSRLKACNFIKKRIQHRCFAVNIAKFIRTVFFTEHLWWLLLKFVSCERLSITVF